MEFGISTLSRGLYTSRAAYMAVAQAAEQAGFGFMSVNDHIIVPANLGSAYPYTPGGTWSASEHGHCFDQLAALGFLAGCTTRLRLLTSVMVVPHRPVIQTAKMLSTIDVLSNGRLILGVGAGWMSEEFRLLGAPFKERGAVTDEYLEAFKELWTKDRPSYQGSMWLSRTDLWRHDRSSSPSADLGGGEDQPRCDEPSSSVTAGIPATTIRKCRSTRPSGSQGA